MARTWTATRWNNGKGRKNRHRTDRPKPSWKRSTHVRAVETSVETDPVHNTKTYVLPEGSKLLCRVENEDDAKKVCLQTNYPGTLLLHWGVQGGKGSRGKQGWWLPGEKTWPENTCRYKKRALQTPWKRTGDALVLDIRLPDEETGDALVFVLKDPQKNKWYDDKSDNFRIPLTEEDGNDAETDGDQRQTARTDTYEVPQDLAGVWAYLMWTNAGSPERSFEEANLEYQAAVEELQQLLEDGYPIEDLYKASRGEKTISGSSIAPKETSEAGASVSRSPPQEEIPMELVGIQAYILWENSGKPDGADFTDQAKAELAHKLRSGETLQQIEKALKEPASVERGPSEEVNEPAAPRPSESDEGTPSSTVTEEVRESGESPPSPPPKSQDVPPPPPLTSTQNLDMRDLIRKPDHARRSLIPESAKTRSPLEPYVAEAAADPACKWRRLFRLGDKASLFVAAFVLEDGSTRVDMVSDCNAELVAHWGVSRDKRRMWELPPLAVAPPGTATVNDIAMETEFSPEEGKYEIGGKLVPTQTCSFTLPAKHDIAGLIWVLRSKDETRWWKDGDSNFRAPVPGGALDVSSVSDDALVQVISDAENSGAWTLMHRYNRVSDLLDDVISGQYGKELVDPMAKLFVWLRFSSTRQLTWQRNYNTQPRILSAAQERLTHKIVEAYERSSGEAKEWARQMLTCVGRGGEGQKVRDDILHIMHKHRIPELKGTWMEEWHQKLHNNTTPDDVAICEAYIAFLEENGDNATYWRVLSDMGVSRDRLESFERPIRCEPEDFPDKRAELIGDFREYLSVLKAVHSAADLTHSVSAAGNMLPEELKGTLGYVLANRESADVHHLLEAAVNARTVVHTMMDGHRDLMYLDLALEGLVRSLAERGAGDQRYSTSLLGPLLQNLCLSVADNEEFVYCLMSWKGLSDTVFTNCPSQEDALKAMAVVDRLRRALSNLSEAVSQRIQPAAESLGRAFGVEEWNIQLFAEETIRGGSAFAVSLVLTPIEATLRSAAKLSAWQVISPSHVYGVVEVVPDLHVVQEKVYEMPTVLVSEQVAGEEEVPEGVVGVVTPSAPDVLSHVAVRARNMKVFLATCYERSPIDQLATLQGKAISLQSTASGEVTYHEVHMDRLMANGSGSTSSSNGNFGVLEVPDWCGEYTLVMDEFASGKVGAKSKNLAGLRGKLPEWVNLPPSVTLPFGSFETALDHPDNKTVKRDLELLLKKVSDTPLETLAACRSTAMRVSIPSELQSALATNMKKAGLQWPGNRERWDEAFTALKKVWASKYNDRAYFSMKKVGLKIDSLRMAVLVQRVVPAKYAFVIHTRNPSTGDDREIYAEIVCGLGETLVGNYPGRPLAFVAKKDDLSDIIIESYPSKSVGLFCPESLIFRSDSNGEDLDGYAGAGLYDSVTMDSTIESQVDYSTDPLLADEKFMHDLCYRIASVGKAIEDALGTAQDIEGAVEDNGEITVVQTRPQV